MKSYLTHPEKLELFQSVVSLTGGDYGSYRVALLQGMPPEFKGLLPRASADAPQLMSDLTRINETDRLVDGTVPLVTFLQTLLALFGTVDRQIASLIRRWLAEVEQAASGAPAVAPVTVDEVKEALVHQNDMLPAHFMREGLKASAAVAKLEVTPRQGGVEVVGKTHLGTGWLIAPGLLLTNHHVINARTKGEAPASDTDLALQVRGMRVLFDYDHAGVISPSVAAAELVASDAKLDYALIRIEDTNRTPLAISVDVPTPRPGHGAPALNIIQHPDGDPKQFAIRNNLMASATDEDMRYFTDTKGGSSGAPVFDDGWRVVALHRGASFAPGVSFQGREAIYMNVGTRMSAIVAHLNTRQRQTMSAGAAEALARLLENVVAPGS